MENKKEPEKYTLLFQHWKKYQDKILLTNDFGGNVEVPKNEFESICSKDCSLSKTDVPEEFFDKGFVAEMIDSEKHSLSWAKRHCSVMLAPELHIMVMTGRCNMQCVYCQAGAPGRRDKSLDMSLETAKKAVDFAFNTPSPVLSFEFQGGEPLLNWDVLVSTVEYIREKEKKSSRTVSISLISNFILMDDKKADFLLKNEVILCTSLDGPEFVHSKNRHSENDISYETVRKWLKYFKERHDNQKGNSYRIFKPGAIVTVTKNSIGHAKEIVDEYVAAGLESIYLRPVSKIGYAGRNWNVIGITPAEYLDFYSEALKHIIELNKKGISISEQACIIFCTKMFDAGSGGNYDIDSPCGAGTGQIAYNYDGSIYTCDEGRMLAMDGDDIFRIGSVDEPVEKVLTADAVRACKCASELNAQAMCSRCAYMPYCGTCPVFNYATQGSLAGDMANNMRCAINKGQIDIILECIKDRENEAILKKWITGSF